MLDIPKQSADDTAGYGFPLEKLLTTQLLKLTNSLNRQSAILLDEAASLRLPEWRCLAFIAAWNGTQGKVSLNQIADATGIDRGALSRAIQNLVEKNLILTDRDGADRRVVYATLTDKGQQAYQITLPVMRKRHASLLEALSPMDREAIFRIIDQLISVVDHWEKDRTRK